MEPLQAWVAAAKSEMAMRAWVYEGRPEAAAQLIVAEENLKKAREQVMQTTRLLEAEINMALEEIQMAYAHYALVVNQWNAHLLHRVANAKDVDRGGESVERHSVRTGDRVAQPGHGRKDNEVGVGTEPDADGQQCQPAVGSQCGDGGGDNSPHFLIAKDDVGILNISQRIDQLKWRKRRETWSSRQITSTMLRNVGAMHVFIIIVNNYGHQNVRVQGANETMMKKKRD